MTRAAGAGRIVAIRAALRNHGPDMAELYYTGVCHIACERDFEKNAMDLAEGFGYYRSVLDGLGL